MRKHIYLFLAVISWLPLFAQPGSLPRVAGEAAVDQNTFTGILTADYANGTPKLRKEVNQGKASGQWLEWYADGTLRFRSWWKEGLGHGKWEYFYPNGNLRSVGVYEKDQPQGLHYQYHPNGQISEEASYVAGKREGIVYTFDAAGNPTGRQRYLGGEKVLDQPVLFEPGKIATEANNEWDLTFTPGGDTLYFTRREAGSEKAIYTSVRTAGRWSAPVPAAFGRPGEGGAFVSPDGQRLYSETNDPVSGSNTPDGNIWYRTRQGAGWSTPLPLGANINGVAKAGEQWPANYESAPVTDPAGNLYYWTKSRSTNAARLFTARIQRDGSFADPSEITGNIAGPGWEFSPVISPDGNYLIFASTDRDDRYGDADLYYAKRLPDGQWSSPKNLGPDVNSPGYDSFPRFSPDGKYFFFSSNRDATPDAGGERAASIYYLESRFLLMD